MKLEKAVEIVNSCKNLPRLLRRNGIKGRKEIQCDCPVARYLQLRTGKKVYVTMGSVSTNNHYKNALLLSDEVGSFILDFDNGKYPNLVAA